jgi:hypothetical protein
MPREKVKASLMEKRSPVGPMTAGLSNAERELVRVHREEFAFQLRQASWIKLAADGVGPRVVSRQGQGVNRISVPSTQDTRNRLDKAAHQSGLPHPAQYSVPDWIDSPIHQWPSAASIAIVAHRISPNSLDSFYAGADHLICRLPHTALECFASALEQQFDPAVESPLIANMANCYDQLGDLGRSISLWKIAHHRDPQRLDFVGCWFLVSMRSGQDGDIMASNRVLSSFDQSLTVLEELAKLVAARRELGFWSSTGTLRSALMRWSTRLSAGGNTLAHSLR